MGVAIRPTAPTSAGPMHIDYTSFDLPYRITRGADTTLISYDPDEHRAFFKAPDESTVTYAGGVYEKRTTADGATDTHVFYVHDGARVIAQVPWQRTGGVLLKQRPRIFMTIISGSIETVAGPSGVQSFRYDPFGRRIELRNPTRDGVAASDVRKGFTAHEHDDAAGPREHARPHVHPRAGRFLSPDPYVASPYDGQSLNRYSYVNNNPLNWVDPSGFEAGGASGGPATEQGYGMTGNQLASWWEKQRPPRGGARSGRAGLSARLVARIRDD